MWKVIKQLTHGKQIESPPNSLTADIFNDLFGSIGLGTVSHLQPVHSDDSEARVFWRASNCTCHFRVRQQIDVFKL